MKIKLNGWQRIGVVLNAIYLIIIIIIAWYEWPTQKQIESSWVYSALDAIRKPESPYAYKLRESRFKDISDRELIELINSRFLEHLKTSKPGTAAFLIAQLEGELVTPGETIAQQCEEKLKEVNLRYQKEIESLGIDRLKIVGIFIMWWIIPSGIVYLLGFSIGWIYRGFKENKTSTKQPSTRREP